jgi:radical SAM superfamily enzyme YgiQ (UPF0313 family)
MLVDVARVPFVEKNPAYAAVNHQKAELERSTYSPAYAHQFSGRPYNYGLLSIGNHIRDLGIEVGYTDIDAINEDPDPTRFKAADVVLIGLNFCVAEPVVIDLARKIKGWNPETVIVIGGHHATYRAKYLLETVPEVDVVIKGEGEAPVRNLLTQPHQIQHLSGLAFRFGSMIADKSMLPPLPGNYVPGPDYGLLNRPMSEYGIRMVTTRGCAKSEDENQINGSCRFCAEKKFFGKVRSRPVESIASELEDLALRVNKKTHIHIADSNIAWDEKRLIELSNTLKRFKKVFEFSGNLYAGSVNERVLTALHLANFSRLFVGLEDPSPKILKLMNKGIQHKDVIGALTWIRWFGFSPAVYTIYGLPGSTPESLQSHTKEVASLIEGGLVDEIFSAMYAPVPGTHVYDRPELYGVEIIDHDWTHYQRDNGPIFRLKEVDADELREGYHEFKKAIIDAYSKHPRVKNRG